MNFSVLTMIVPPLQVTVMSPFSGHLKSILFVSSDYQAPTQNSARTNSCPAGSRSVPRKGFFRPSRAHSLLYGQLSDGAQQACRGELHLEGDSTLFLRGWTMTDLSLPPTPNMVAVPWEVLKQVAGRMSGRSILPV